MLLIFLLTFSLIWGRELKVEDALKLALENNRELKALHREIEAGRLGVKSAKGAYFPRLKLEETFTRTDVPVYVFMNKLNQERITLQDFDPGRLNNPKGINNFETKIGLEVPIWVGGKLQTVERIATLNLSVLQSEYARKKEEIALKVYQAYLDAVLTKSAIKVSEQSLKEALEHQRLAQQMYEAGLALLSDVFRAKVYVEQAKEKLEASKKDYKIAKKALELVLGTSLGDFEVEEIKECPVVETKELFEIALQKREDLKAMRIREKIFEEYYKLEISNNLPNVYAGAFYFLNSKDHPLGADGKGYMLTIGFSWTFDTGLSTLNQAKAHLERKRAMEERVNGLKDLIAFEVEKSKADYEKALSALNSARERVKASNEVLRVMELRYKNGLARMVDLLDAQSQLDMARFEEIRAITDCWKAIYQLDYSVGTILEVKR
ncbi:TolC family protein [Thermocrinis sp.]